MEGNEEGVLNILPVNEQCRGPRTGRRARPKATFCCRSECQTSEQAVGPQCTRTEAGETGSTSGCLGWRPRVISDVRGYASCMVTEGNGKFGSFWDIFSAHRGGSLLWNALARNDLTQPDCPWPAFHQEQELAWTHWGRRWQTVLYRQDTSSSGLEDKIPDELMNEPKLAFTWLRQTSVCFKWDFFYANFCISVSFNV